MERRAWLNPLNIARQVSDLASNLIGEDLHQGHSFLRLSRPAMATEFEVLLPIGCPKAQTIGEMVLNLVDQLEAQLTVYRETSEVCHINRRANNYWVHPEIKLYRLLAKAKEIAQETQYGFDPTSGPLIKLWGFFKGPKRVPEENEIQKTLYQTGVESLEFNDKDFSLRFQKPGMELNLGAIGKGYALDQASALIRNRFNISTFLLQGGRSSILAGDCPSGRNRGWPIRICHPWEKEKTLAIVELKNRALGISAATYNYFEANGVKYGHVIDPLTGRPTQGVACCAVFAPDCASADALSTAFFTRGLESAEAYCAKNPDVGVLLLEESGVGKCQAVGNLGCQATMF